MSLNFSTISVQQQQQQTQNYIQQQPVPPPPPQQQACRTAAAVRAENLQNNIRNMPFAQEPNQWQNKRLMRT